jgi:3D (Asp-Asp-Asp) domain-containing protein
MLRLLGKWGYLSPLWVLAITAALFSARACFPQSSQPVAVTIAADGQERNVMTSAACVAEVLAENRVALGELDRVSPDLGQPVADGLKITVTRIARLVKKERRPIPPGALTRYDDRVGRPITLHPGQPGLVEETVRIHTKDGRETLREVLSSQVVRKPVPGRVVRGRWSKLPARGARMLVMTATAYDPGPRSCGRFASGWTAVGMRAGKGVVAVDPSVIPLGTRLYIEGYGYAVAGDVGGAIRGRRIDLGFETYRQAIAFGRRAVWVYILD